MTDHVMRSVGRLMDKYYSITIKIIDLYSYLIIIANHSLQ